MIQKKYNKYMKFTLLTLFVLFVVLCSASVVYAQTVVPGSGGSNISFPNPFEGGSQGAPSSLFSFVTFVLNKIVLPIGAVVVVFFIIYSGYLFVTAGGDQKKLDSAKKTFWGVVIGTAVLLGSLTIAQAIKSTVCQIAGPSSDICNI